MDYAVVRTKLQAIVVREMLRQGLMCEPLTIIEVHDEASARADIKGQRALFAGMDVSYSDIDRSRTGRLALAWRLSGLLRKVRRGDARLFISNLHWAALGLALKLMPGTRIHSFDDGAANVQRNPGTFLDETSSRRRGIGGALSRMFFPRGVAHFARSRIARHATIYPGRPNVVPADRLDTVTIRWASMLEPSDSPALRPGVSRVLIGTVYDQLNTPTRTRADPTVVDAAIRWADLYIPHPRQGGAVRDEVLVRYPAECLVDWHAQAGPLVVAHFNSSVALSFADDPRIRWIDLLDLPPDRLSGTLPP